MLDGGTSQGGTPWVVGGRSNVGSILAVIAYQDGGSWTIDYDGLIDGVFRLFDIEMFSGTEGVAVGFDSILRRYP